MYFVKFQPLLGEKQLLPIKSDNVVCMCPECGREVSVDLQDASADHNLDLSDDTFLCKECQNKFFEEMRAQLLQVTFEAIINLIASALAREAIQPGNGRFGPETLDILEKLLTLYAKLNDPDSKFPFPMEDDESAQEEIDNG